MGQMRCLDPYLIFLIGLSMVASEHLPATGRTTVLFGHDLVGKPASTFPDHALSCAKPNGNTQGIHP
jgi:hypothetical protein